MIENDNKINPIFRFNVNKYSLLVIYKIELTYMDDFVYKYRSFLIFLDEFCEFVQKVINQACFLSINDVKSTNI